MKWSRRNGVIATLVIGTLLRKHWSIYSYTICWWRPLLQKQCWIYSVSIGQESAFNIGLFFLILIVTEEPNLTACWICFFYFNLCFPLFWFTKRILSTQNALPQGTLPLCLNDKPNCLCSGKHPDPIHLWMAARKKKLTHPLPEAGHSRVYLHNLWASYFTSLSPLPLCSIKETGIQTPIRCFFGDISLPSSGSASFPNKVVFLASTPRLPIYWSVLWWAEQAWTW